MREDLCPKNKTFSEAIAEKGEPTPRFVLTLFWRIRSDQMVAVSLAAIAGNRVGYLGHARGQPAQLTKLFARAQVDLHLGPADA